MRNFDVAYFAASCDEPNVNKKFAASLDLDFVLLSDPSRETAAKYGVVNESRKVPFRWTFYIARNGKILLVDKSVKAASHGADIVAKLTEMGVGRKKSGE